MRSSLCLFVISLLFGTVSAAHAAQSVHLRPDGSSPVIGTTRADDVQFAPPAEGQLTQQQRDAGWRAISYLSDFRGFVRRADLSKDLNVTPGALIYASPQAADHLVLARAAANDLFEIERLAGDWVEVSFRKPLTGYVQTGQTQAAPPPPPQAQRQIEEARPLFEDLPAQNQGTATRGPVIGGREGIPTDGTMRLFEGNFTRSRSFLGRQPPYPFQMVDRAGNRIAYLDLTKLLITTPVDRFLDRDFLIYGRAEPLEGRRDFVIRVEHMQLK